MRTGEYNILSAHGSDTAKNRESLGKIWSLYFINTMSSEYSKQIISWHRIRSIICTTQNKYWWVLLVITLCQLMDKIRPKTWNPSGFFNSILLISCLPMLFWITDIFWNIKTFRMSGLKKLFRTREPQFYKGLFQTSIEVQSGITYSIFLVSIGYEK